ncbi:molecular chaperone TorD family protein [Bradyrhizobium rifense]|uniref:Molecular chaperone TorD family protein n=1 Tax=Bradyrhizobium rifense TaxID=515499 RepID=A0A5D3KP47_9BRAD|nr:molecular chaperone TorD family protein [Bradyrhizobium rifense]
MGKAACSVSEQGAAREYFDLFVGLGKGRLLPYASHDLTGSLYGRLLANLRETWRARRRTDCAVRTRRSRFNSLRGWYRGGADLRYQVHDFAR